MSQPENPFEAGVRKVIPAVLVYVQKGGEVLMIHRNSRSLGRIDYHEGKWNGLGGKCELDESPLEAAVREVKEESGLDIPESHFQALGVIQFPNFKAHKDEDWIAFVFSVQLNEVDSHDFLRSSEEGDLHWVPKTDMLSLNLWPGDRYFIPFVIGNRPFMGTVWYRDGAVVKQWFQQI